MTSTHPGRLACWNMGSHVTRRPPRSATPSRGGVGRESPANLRISGGYPIVVQHLCGFPRPPFKEIAVNKAELTSALAMRTKMSKADATRTVEALFDDKGIIEIGRAS